MRYFTINDISFTNKNGVTVAVKDRRPIPSEQIAFEIDILSDADLDEVATRSNVYGDDAEDQSYRVFDANVVELTESRYELSALRKLKIPL